MDGGGWTGERGGRRGRGEGVGRGARVGAGAGEREGRSGERGGEEGGGGRAVRGREEGGGDGGGASCKVGEFVFATKRAAHDILLCHGCFPCIYLTQVGIHTHHYNIFGVTKRYWCLCSMHMSRVVIIII